MRSQEDASLAEGNLTKNNKARLAMGGLQWFVMHEGCISPALGGTRI